MKTLEKPMNERKQKQKFAVKHTAGDGRVSYLSNGDKTCWSKYYAKSIGKTFIASFGGKFELEKAESYEQGN